MTARVMVVDDSAAIRGFITRALEADPEIKVISSAADGNTAITFARQQPPDVIILDIEMPGMDGFTALPLLLKEAPNARIIMCSTLTQRNAAISMEAMALGAADYLPKPSSLRGSEEASDFHRELRDKVRALAGLASGAPIAPLPTAINAHPRPAVSPEPVALRPAPSNAVPAALAIASSTGGPQALLQLFQGLKGKLEHLPVFITQHMPPTFTMLLAEQIGRVSGHPCKEAIEGEEVRPGHIYVAPGNFHMTVKKPGARVTLHLDQNPPVNFCRPAADPMLDSLVSAYGERLLVLVLTGMGSDGMHGCEKVIEAGGSVIAQDEMTSVVYGMPKAVADRGLCQAVLPLPDIAPYVLKRLGARP